MTQAFEVQPPGRLLAALVTRGLLTPAEVLDGVTLEDLSRSNPVTAISVGAEPRFVVKQRGIQVDDQDPLTTEISAYRWLGRVGLASLGPRPISELGDRVLVLERIDPATSLHDLVVTGAPNVASAFAALGAALGRLHAAGLDAAAEMGLVPRHPWVLDLTQRGLPMVVPATTEVVAVQARLLASHAVVKVLTGLAATGSASAVVHGDVKFDNVLVVIGSSTDEVAPLGDTADPVRVRLIDWELAGIGEPGWDVAGIVEGVVTAQLLTTGRIDVPPAAGLVRPALAAYRSSCPAIELSSILEWTVARLAQASLQLAAMAGEEGGVDERAAEVADLAISFAEEPRAWGPVVGMSLAETT